MHTNLDTHPHCVCGWRMTTKPDRFQSKWCNNPNAMPHHAHLMQRGERCGCRLCAGNTESRRTHGGNGNA
jgi:hypothetical protein